MNEPDAFTNLDQVIQEPGRMMIVALLAAVEKCDLLYLLRETGQDESNLSIHLAKLEAAGYVEIEKKNHGKVPQTLIHLTRSGHAAFEAYRKALNRALAEQLKLASHRSNLSKAQQRAT